MNSNLIRCHLEFFNPWNLLLRNVERINAFIFLLEKLRNLGNKEWIRPSSILWPCQLLISWLSSRLIPGSFFFKVISNTVPDSATVVAITGESKMSSFGILLSQVSVLFSPFPGHSERFHSLKGHHSVHYVLDASFILSWRSLFIEAKLALRMETNGKRMCIWIHIVLFMPMGPWLAARIRVFYLFIYFREHKESLKKWINIAWNWILGKKEPCIKEQCVPPRCNIIL